MRRIMFLHQDCSCCVTNWLDFVDDATKSVFIWHSQTWIKKVSMNTFGSCSNDCLKNGLNYYFKKWKLNFLTLFKSFKVISSPSVKFTCFFHLALKTTKRKKNQISWKRQMKIIWSERGARFPVSSEDSRSNRRRNMKKNVWERDKKKECVERRGDERKELEGETLACWSLWLTECS